MFSRAGQIGGLDGANLLAFDQRGNLFESDSDSGMVYKFTPSGNRSTFASGLSEPEGLTFGPNGNLFAAERLGGTIDEFTSTGIRSTFATGLYYPNGLAFDQNGNLFVSDDYLNNAIYEFTPNGTR